MADDSRSSLHLWTLIAAPSASYSNDLTSVSPNVNSEIFSFLRDFNARHLQAAGMMLSQDDRSAGKGWGKIELPQLAQGGDFNVASGKSAALPAGPEI